MNVEFNQHSRIKKKKILNLEGTLEFISTALHTTSYYLYLHCMLEELERFEDL